MKKKAIYNNGQRLKQVDYGNEILIKVQHNKQYNSNYIKINKATDLTLLYRSTLPNLIFYFVTFNNEESPKNNFHSRAQQT